MFIALGVIYYRNHKNTIDIINSEKEGFLLEKEITKLEANKCKIQMETGINIIGFILVIMAGWIDTVGVKLLLIESPAFMTGRGLILGYHAFLLDIKTLMNIVLVIIAFILGAFISTKITSRTGLTGGLVFTGLLIITAALPICSKHVTIDAILVPMAMGCQNAATSLTPINRTTHLTGPATDIGINIAKGNWKLVGFWIWRWMGFPLGSIIGFALVKMVNNNIIDIATTLIVPGIIIILTAIGQKVIFDIPLLDKEVSE